MTSDDKRCANRLRMNGDKLLLLSRELETFPRVESSDYTKRREQIRIAIANTLADLKEVADSLGEGVQREL